MSPQIILLIVIVVACCLCSIWVKKNSDPKKHLPDFMHPVIDLYNKLPDV